MISFVTWGQVHESTYALSFRMGTSLAVVMLVEVHHLDTVELSSDIVDLVLFTFLEILDLRVVPEMISFAFCKVDQLTI